MPSDYTERGQKNRPWGAAALWCLLLAVLFFATYNAANGWTAQRQDVGVVVFGWERHIPFLPWTIVPYWSIDLLYGISLFLCTTRRELQRHVARLLCAQLICVSGFLLFPLRFSFERPETAGLFGWMFDTLAGFDKPFNQAPSLHIALLVILWQHYGRHLRDQRFGAFATFVLHGWFALIGVSVLTTYQHHFIDIVAGFWAGLLCLFIVGEVDALDARDARGARWRWGLWRAEPKRIRMAWRYGLPALLVLSVGVCLPAWAAWLVWWAGAALLLVALIYLFGEGAHFGKLQGRQAWWVRCLLAPYLLGARINAWCWTRRLPPHVRIAENVWLGRMPASAAQLRGGSFDGVLDLCAELAFPVGPRAYESVLMLDLLPPEAEQLQLAAQRLETLRATHGGSLLVCCALGFSRSAAVVAAWLVCHRGMSVDAAIMTIRERRPQIVLSDELRRRLNALVEDEIQ